MQRCWETLKNAVNNKVEMAQFVKNKFLFTEHCTSSFFASHAKFVGVLLMENHASYSPDLAPSNFHIGGWHFQMDTEVKQVEGACLKTEHTVVREEI